MIEASTQIETQSVNEPDNEPDNEPGKQPNNQENYRSEFICPKPTIANLIVAKAYFTETGAQNYDGNRHERVK